MTGQPESGDRPAEAAGERFNTVIGSDSIGEISSFTSSLTNDDLSTLATILERFGVANKSTVLESGQSASNAARDAVEALIKDGLLTEYQADIIRKKGPNGLVFEEYLLVDALGAGGMGEVFKAKNLALGRMEAIKTIRDEQGISQLFAKRFKQEARLLALLEHANFVPIYRYGRAGDVDFIAMRFVEGETVKHRIDEAIASGTPLPWRDVCRWFIEAARALDFAHKANVIHRDLKPSNLMVSPRGGIVVLDMGIARLLDDGASSAAEGLTATSRALGTPEYMPPEQWADARAVTFASDVYSMGVSLFHTLALRPPFKSDKVSDLMLAHTAEKPPKITAFRSDVPRELDAIIARCLEKKPADRYPSMGAFADDLERIVANAATKASAESNAMPGWVWPSLAAVAVLAASAFVWINRDRFRHGKAPLEIEPTLSAKIEPSTATTTDRRPETKSDPETPKKSDSPPSTAIQSSSPSPASDWIAEYVSRNAGEWATVAELRKYALDVVNNDPARLAERTADLIKVLDGETRRRRLEKIEPMKFLTSTAVDDPWSASAVAAVRSIVAMHGAKPDPDLHIEASFVDLDNQRLDVIHVGQRFQVTVKPSKPSYVTFVQLDGGFLFVFPFPKLIPANETLALTNVLAFGSPGQKNFIIYATDRPLVERVVPPDPDDEPRLPRLFATRDAYDRIETCLREGKPAGGIPRTENVGHWSRLIVHLEVVP